jgi:uncharacterized membrane protein
VTIPAIQTQPAAGPIPEPRVVHNVEVALGYILRLGVAISISLVVLGTCVSFYHHPEYFKQWYPIQHSADKPDVRTVSEVGDGFPTSFKQTLTALADFTGQGLVVLGLLVLLATPVVSVATAIIAFTIQKDRAFTIIASMVLLILCISFFLGRAEGVDTSNTATQPATAHK